MVSGLTTVTFFFSFFSFFFVFLVFLFFNLAYSLFLSGGKCTPVLSPPVLGTKDFRPRMCHVVQNLHLLSIPPSPS